MKISFFIFLLLFSIVYAEPTMPPSPEDINRYMNELSGDKINIQKDVEKSNNNSENNFDPEDPMNNFKTGLESEDHAVLKSMGNMQIAIFQFYPNNDTIKENMNRMIPMDRETIMPNMKIFDTVKMFSKYGHIHVNGFSSFQFLSDKLINLSDFSSMKGGVLISEDHNDNREIKFVISPVSFILKTYKNDDKKNKDKDKDKDKDFKKIKQVYLPPVSGDIHIDKMDTIIYPYVNPFDKDAINIICFYIVA